MKIGLFFGSFNPIHVGHLIIANYMVENTDLDEIWMVITPHNPHKKRRHLAADYDRLDLVNMAVENHSKLRASDVEFDLPKPSYTIETLTYLNEEYPQHNFILIMGGDNLATLPKWKNYEQILVHYGIYVYKRPAYELGNLAAHPKVVLFDAPLMTISSSFIRKMIKEGKSIRYWVTEKVLEGIESKGMYQVRE